MLEVAAFGDDEAEVVVVFDAVGEAGVGLVVDLKVEVQVQPLEYFVGNVQLRKINFFDFWG